MNEPSAVAVSAPWNGRAIPWESVRCVSRPMVGGPSTREVRRRAPGASTPGGRWSICGQASAWSASQFLSDPLLFLEFSRPRRRRATSTQQALPRRKKSRIGWGRPAAPSHAGWQLLAGNEAKPGLACLGHSLINRLTGPKKAFSPNLADIPDSESRRVCRELFHPGCCPSYESWPREPPVT